jgi:hypothetical protein
MTIQEVLEIIALGLLYIGLIYAPPVFFWSVVTLGLLYIGLIYV